MKKRILRSDRLPEPKGPYSVALTLDHLLFVSGQGPAYPDTGEIVKGSFEEQAKLTFDNVTVLLEAAGTSWEHVVRVGIFLSDLGNFGQMNEIYKAYLIEPYPARTTVEVGLPANMEIEVDCIALVPK